VGSLAAGREEATTLRLRKLGLTAAAGLIAAAAVVQRKRVGSEV